MAYLFGDFILDERTYQLRRAGVVVRLEPKVFDVLRYLVLHRERVVSKDELLEKLWPGEHVSESVLPRCVTAVRKALGDDATGPRFIQTVHGRGYRFVAAVGPDVAATPTSDSKPGVGVSPAPAIASDDPVGGESLEAPLGLFVGRERAMTELHAALADVLAGRGRLVFLVGEPGIGKTRTADELAAGARKEGMRTYAGRCYEAAGAPAFWPWVQILRGLGAPLLSELGADAADVAKLVPELEERLSDRAPAMSVAPEQARFRLFDTITSLLKQASRNQPLVLILDDLHWADKPSLLLLQFLVREIRDASILVVGTYRDVELKRTHPLAQLLGDLAREPHCERITLRGLDEKDVADFLAASAGKRPSDSLVGAIHQMTEGNPFFIGEIVRWLAEAGRLDAEEPPDAGAWSVVLPQGVREAIGRRLDALSEECNQILTLACVIGREFGLGLLERLTDLSVDRILAALDEAIAARIVSRPLAAVGRYSFSHTLIRESLYEELTTPLRVRLHRQVGAVLEELHPSDPARLSELAHHFFQAAAAGDVEKAVDYEARAAERALQLLAHEQAVAHYERALEALDLKASPEQERRVDLLLALGEAQSRSGERDKARRTFQRAAEIARSLSSAERLALAALGFGGRAEFGSVHDSMRVALLEEALGKLGEADGNLRARILSCLTGTAPYSDSMEMRGALSRQAVELARSVGDRGTLAWALRARAWALLGPDHVDERFAIGTELLELAERRRDKGSAFVGREFRFGVLLALGEVTAADRELAAMEQLARELRQPLELWFVTWFRASRALADGRYEDAERLMQEGLTLGQRAQHP